MQVPQYRRVLRRFLKLRGCLLDKVQIGTEAFQQSKEKRLLVFPCKSGVGRQDILRDGDSGGFAPSRQQLFAQFDHGDTGIPVPPGIEQRPPLFGNG